MSNEKITDSKKLKSVLPRFKKNLKEEGKKWVDERDKKEEFFNTYLKEAQIDSLDEGVLRELVQLLWCFYGWTNKNYLLPNLEMD